MERTRHRAPPFGVVKPAKAKGRGKKMAQEEEESDDPIDEPEEPQPTPQPQRRKRKLTKKEQQEEEDKKGKWVVKDLYFGPGIQGQYIGEMRPSRQEWTFEFHPWVKIAEEPPAQQAKGKAQPKNPAMDCPWANALMGGMTPERRPHPPG
ncbi:MAG: hypothetical protein LQ350_003237 [Teloschistes chrysophthalmus]|nr:MAG: hypothetical protein LQ350_003237 [Niorma chrysophthalma]